MIPDSMVARKQTTTKITTKMGCEQEIPLIQCFLETPVLLQEKWGFGHEPLGKWGSGHEPLVCVGNMGFL